MKGDRPADVWNGVGPPNEEKVGIPRGFREKPGKNFRSEPHCDSESSGAAAVHADFDQTVSSVFRAHAFVPPPSREDTDLDDLSAHLDVLDQVAAAARGPETAVYLGVLAAGLVVTPDECQIGSSDELQDVVAEVCLLGTELELDLQSRPSGWERPSLQVSAVSEPQK